MTQEVKSGSHPRSISGGGNGKPLKIREVYVGRGGKPVLVWSENIQGGYVAYNNQDAYYSRDLVKWRLISGLDGAGIRKIIYGNGRLLCYANDGAIFRCVNGKTWEKTAEWTIRPDVFGNGKFVSVSTTQTTLTVNCSDDGVAFQSVTSNIGTQHYATAYIHYMCGKFFIIRDSVLYESDDAASWTKTYDFKYISFGPKMLAGSGNLLVAAKNPLTNEKPFAYKVNGVWALSDFTTSMSVYSLVYGNGTFIARTSNRSIYSRDGSSWAYGAVSPAFITFDGIQFVSIAENHCDVSVSSDGYEWNRVYTFENEMANILKLA